MVKRLIILCFLFFIGFNVGFAQKYDFTTYGTDEGLAHNQVFEIIQSDSGYLWIATLGGVSKFNGTIFKNYTLDDGLSSNLLLTILEDTKGRIWTGSYDKGVNIITNDSIIQLGKEFAVKYGAVDAIEESKTGEVYIFYNRAIFVFNDQSPNVLNLVLELDKEIGDVILGKDDMVYAATYTGGLAKIDLKTKQVEYFNSETHGINNIQYSVYLDPYENLWSGGYGELVKWKENQVDSIFKFDTSQFDQNRVKSIYSHNDNELLLGFEGNGFGKFNTLTQKLELINTKNGLPSDYVFNIVKDSENNVWMSTYGHGIVKYRDATFSLYDESQGLPSNQVTNVIKHKDKLWVGTENGIALIDKKSNIETKFEGTHITSINKIGEDNLLITTDEKVITFSNDSVTTVLDENVYSYTYTDSVRTIFSSFKFLKVVEEDNTFTIPSSRYVDIVPIANNYILARLGGMFELKNEKLDSISGLNPSEHRIFRTMDKVNRNGVLAGNTEKLYHITNENGKYKFKTFSLNRFGNLDNFNALQIAGNNLWLAGDRLLKKVDLEALLKRDTVIYKDFVFNSRLLSDAIDNNGLYTISDHLLAGTSTNGLLMFDETQFLENEKPPTIRLSDVFLFSERFGNQFYNNEKSQTFSYEENYLTFVMEAISFTHPENVSYKYRLEGLRDNKWSFPTQDNKVVYSYLPPGDYNFQFVANNGSGVWTKTPVQYSFTIEQPFWKSLFFWIVLVVSIMGGLLLLVFFRNKLAQKRLIKFSQGLIQAQEDERSRVARDLHDSVSQQLIMITKKSRDTGDQILEVLATNTLENLRTISHNLHPAVLEQLGYKKAMEELIHQLKTQSEVRFSFHCDEVDDLFSQDTSLHLYRVAQEACQNVLKHAQAKNASVEVTKQKQSLMMKIEDNGKGMGHNVDIKRSKGLGMKSIMERCSLISAEFKIISNVNKGTKILVTLPINNVQLQP